MTTRLYREKQYLLNDVACYFSEKAVDERGQPSNRKPSEIYDEVAAIVIDWLKRSAK